MVKYTQKGMKRGRERGREREGGKVSEDGNICTTAEREEEDVLKIYGMMGGRLSRSESRQGCGLWTGRGKERENSAQAHLLKETSCYL